MKKIVLTFNLPGSLEARGNRVVALNALGAAANEIGLPGGLLTVHADTEQRLEDAFGNVVATAVVS